MSLNDLLADGRLLMALRDQAHPSPRSIQGVDYPTGRSGPRSSINSNLSNHHHETGEHQTPPTAERVPLIMEPSVDMWPESSGWIPFCSYLPTRSQPASPSLHEPQLVFPKLEHMSPPRSIPPPEMALLAIFAQPPPDQCAIVAPQPAPTSYFQASPNTTKTGKAKQRETNLPGVTKLILKPPKVEHTANEDHDGLGPKRREMLSRVCWECGTKVTVQWRNGPLGRATLCNPCGIKYSRDQKRARAQSSLGM